MPDVDILIGGRTFQVACQPGEEHFPEQAEHAARQRRAVLAGIALDEVDGGRPPVPLADHAVDEAHVARALGAVGIGVAVDITFGAS